MSLELLGPAFVAAGFAAAAMGFAIQRGGTCTVAAVDDIVSGRGARRLAAMAEAALWVAGGLLLLHATMRLASAPAGYAVGAFTVLGGALLGLGAFVNRACVFGAIARLGSGEWAYLATPVGFYLGCLSVGALFAPPAPARSDGVVPLLQASGALAAVFVAFAAWRVVQGARRIARGGAPAGFATRAWTPHAATIVIGLTFVVTLWLGGAWAYTDLLADLAMGRGHDAAVRIGLALALFAGAVAGGFSAGRPMRRRPTAAQLARCLAGGVLMGWGSLLIPGGNDGLLLVGLPLLWPYAWVAFGTMCLAIAAALRLQRLFRNRHSRSSHISVTPADGADARS
jgi:TRAP-type C4-dicarboxylate transport system permease small subunit